MTIAPAELTVISTASGASRVRLTSATTSIGRATECTIPVKDRYLSRKHAEIVSAGNGWVLKDCGSANGTYVNGERVDVQMTLRSGDRIRLGDTEIIFQSDQSTDRILSIAEGRVTPTISIPIHEIVEPTGATGEERLDRLRTLNAIAAEMIEEKSLDELFGFLLDRVMKHLRPSRSAIGLLTPDGASFKTVEVRRQDPTDTSELAISRTLLEQVVHEKRALAFMDIAADERLKRAQSIVSQGIHSVLCTPLLINDTVVGVLYVDYRFGLRTISEDDLRLVAQIGRFAALKLENTRLREDAIQKRIFDEELKTAYVVQQRLLPAAPPAVDGFTVAGFNRPCRTVSGDYFDYFPLPDGTLYFVIADVSGKGVTAALIMAGLQAMFRIFAKSGPSPAVLLRDLNLSLKKNLPQSKFITMFAGKLDPKSGTVDYANAGHTPPLCIRQNGVEELTETDMILGLFPNATYKDQQVVLGAGDALVLFTDGITEAEDEAGAEFGADNAMRAVASLHGRNADSIIAAMDEAVKEFSTRQLATDDVTLMAVARNS
jgi:phosphoserine phosphatase RsbU/P